MRAKASGIVLLTLCLLGIDQGVSTQSRIQNEHWVSTWATALVQRPSQPPPLAALPVQQGQGGPQGAPQAPPRFANQTLRQIVHASIGGERLRVVLSNEFGTAPLSVGAATIARRDKDAGIVEGSARTLTFSGHPKASILPGAVVVSDPVDMTIAPQSDVAIDVYLPNDTASTSSPLTIHAAALQANYLSAPGNHSGAAQFPVMSTMTSWFFLARVEVIAPADVGAVVAFGDSITDGARSTPGTNNRWPDHLAREMVQGGIRMAVINMGIGGNRLLADNNSPSALARLDRDVLVPPGVTDVIVMLGINDLGRGAPAEEVIAAH
jgi:hypothetical protein